MSARFQIDVEPARDLVRITMSGFYSAGDIDSFLAKREAAHRLLTCGPNEHLTLNDVRGMKIQSQDSVQAFQQMLSDPAYRSRRLAFLVDQTLALFQLERALANRDARCFATVQQAEAWPFERRAGEPAPAAARFGRDAA